VLDIATGTGIAAEAAAEITGPELDFPPAII
jgi:ubiquinone/menaquinone biosynthesis C-methylase UbiE